MYKIACYPYLFLIPSRKKIIAAKFFHRIISLTKTTGHVQDNVTNETSKAPELLHNFPIFNSRRGFGKPHSPLLRGVGKQNTVNIQPKKKVGLSMGFNLNISCHDLLSCHVEDNIGGAVFKLLSCYIIFQYSTLAEDLVSLNPSITRSW